MDKKLYAKLLMQRLMYMEERNEEARKIYETLNKKYKDSNKQYYEFMDTLNHKDQIIFRNDGQIYKKSDFTRVRVELSKILIEVENN